MATLDKILYTAKTHTTGGRDGGSSRTDDGRLDVKLSEPGKPGPGSNPEQLFAAAWSAGAVDFAMSCAIASGEAASIRQHNAAITCFMFRSSTG